MRANQEIKRKNRFDGSLIFGTRNFNQTTGRNRHVKDSARAQIDYFIDPKTGRLYRHMAEYRTCPVCRSSNYRELFFKHGFSHVKCACGFILVNPTAKDKFRDHFFSTIYKTWTKVLLSPKQEEIDSRKFGYGIELIQRYNKRKGNLIDIGAGSGLFLTIARRKGWKVSGIEFNAEAAEHIRKLRIQVYEKPLAELELQAELADVVSAWEVLEHINHPDEFLIQVKRILKPRGLLFICVPNSNALVTRILHEKSRTFLGATHVNFFNITTLSKLLNNNGFEVLYADTAISEIGTIHNYLSYNEPYSVDSHAELDFLTPEFIYKHGLGSRIFMLSRKKTGR